jgi:hypothetical protein
MSEEMLLIGDDAVHGEDAYAFSDIPPNILYGDAGAPASGDIESATPTPGKSSSNNDGSGPEPPKAG